MFTDIVGSTAVTARSEPAGLAVRDRHRELVRRQVHCYHGRFVEAPGDESLSTFESALHAVHAALAIQQALEDDPELQVRIGMHLGETMFRGGEVFGDGVNVAARIRELAEPGQILVSGELSRTLQNQPNLATTLRGEHQLKGVAGSVSVHEVTGSAAEPGPAPRAAPQRGRVQRWWVVASGLVLLATFAALAWWGMSPPPTRLRPIRSIAVLPLENLSGDPNQQYFAEGMTDVLISDLAKLGSLRVIARTAVEADAVVEGSVLRAGDRVRITAQLIDTRTDTHLWSESYERNLRDILGLQAEVAQAIAREISHELTPRARQRFRRSEAVEPVAYDATLKGIRLAWSLTPSDHARSVAYFEEALRADPGYAPAYAGLAWAYT